MLYAAPSVNKGTANGMGALCNEARAVGFPVCGMWISYRRDIIGAEKKRSHNLQQVTLLAAIDFQLICCVDGGINLK